MPHFLDCPLTADLNSASHNLPHAIQRLQWSPPILSPSMISTILTSWTQPSVQQALKKLMDITIWNACQSEPNVGIITSLHIAYNGTCAHWSAQRKQPAASRATRPYRDLYRNLRAPTIGPWGVQEEAGCPKDSEIYKDAILKCYMSATNCHQRESNTCNI